MFSIILSIVSLINIGAAVKDSLKKASTYKPKDPQLFKKLFSRDKGEIKIYKPLQLPS